MYKYIICFSLKKGVVWKSCSHMSGLATERSLYLLSVPYVMEILSENLRFHQL